VLRTRVIPSLLLDGRRLVKTVRFRNPTYVGDPINAVKIFNDKQVDELMFLDISASRDGRGPSLDVIGEIASECFMPVGYGGGIRSVDDMREVLKAGIEKVVLNSLAFRQPDMVVAGVREFGSSSIVVSIDVKRKLLGGYEVYGGGGVRREGIGPVEFAQRMAEAGAGEILLNSIDRDGTFQGFDIDLVRRVADAVDVPVIACGGAGSVEHMRQAIVDGHASAVSAGSMFVFRGKHRAVLISFPTPEELRDALP
jgi:cyclase